MATLNLPMQHFNPRSQVSTSCSFRLRTGTLRQRTSLVTDARHRCRIRAILPEEESDLATPGAVTYRRSAVQKHQECYTTLELLGLKKVSSQLSRKTAASMGLVCKDLDGTPVCVSFGVTKDKESGDLQLDGIVKTAAVVNCNRCLAPMAEKMFASFSLLLTKQPVEEPTQQCIGVVLGEEADPDEPVLDLDLDDKLHFPDDVKEIDLSSYIRDTVHLELPFISLCSSSCKGLCIRCGHNLNSSACKCKLSTKASRQAVKASDK